MGNTMGGGAGSIATQVGGNTAPVKPSAPGEVAAQLKALAEAVQAKGGPQRAPAAPPKAPPSSARTAPLGPRSTTAQVPESCPTAPPPADKVRVVAPASPATAVPLKLAADRADFLGRQAQALGDEHLSTDERSSRSFRFQTWIGGLDRMQRLSQRVAEIPDAALRGKMEARLAAIVTGKEADRELSTFSLFFTPAQAREYQRLGEQRSLLLKRLDGVAADDKLGVEKRLGGMQGLQAQVAATEAAQARLLEGTMAPDPNREAPEAPADCSPSSPSSGAGKPMGGKAWTEADIDFLARCLAAEARGEVERNPKLVEAAAYVIAKHATGYSSVERSIRSDPFYLSSWGLGKRKGNARNYAQFFAPTKRIPNWDFLRETARKALMESNDPTGIDPNHFYDVSLPAPGKRGSPSWSKKKKWTQVGHMYFTK